MASALFAGRTAPAVHSWILGAALLLAAGAAGPVLAQTVPGAPGGGRPVTAAGHDLLLPPVAEGRLRPEVLAQIGAVLAEKAQRTPAQAKIDSHLLFAMRVARGETPVGGERLRRAIVARVPVDEQQRTRVEIKGKIDGALLVALGDLGAEAIAAYPEYGSLNVTLPLARLEEAAALPEVRFIGLLPKRRFNAGPDTNGDTAHAGPTTRSALGISGFGVKVGVMSDGVNSLATQQSGGHLPAVTVLPGNAGSGDEGTAMLEIVYTLAPSAQLYFSTAGESDAAMAANIAALAAAGCQVIVDDVTFFDEGAFQDGPIAQAVDNMVGAGGIYFSSAANSGNLDDGTSGTWEGDWAASGSTIAVVNSTESRTTPVQEFGTHDYDQLTAGGGAISLKWSDPLGASANDYDVFFLSSDLTEILDLSTNTQDGTEDPVELMDALGDYPAGDVVVVAQYNGAARYLRIDTNRGQLAVATAGSTFGHNGGQSTVSVAAIPVSQSLGVAFVGGPAESVETYSSDGPRRIFYTPTGVAITPGNFLAATNGGKVLPKVDVTAADCVTTAVTGFSPFCGTSAAAPHAAAIAALALSLPDHPSPDQVRVAMLQSALDIMATGVDRDSGHGVAMASTTTHYLNNLPAARFHTITPCRLVDTRNAAGPLGGPALAANSTRLFTLAGACGVPTGARALAANVTIVQPGASGDVRLYPGDETVSPLATNVSFTAGAVLANNATLGLAHNGNGSVAVQVDSTASTHLLIDVTGYYQ
jgi:hypothetical protein